VKPGRFDAGQHLPPEELAHATGSQSFAGDDLDAERIEYFRAVADYAELVSRGADLRFLVDGADYVLIFELAQLVPTLSAAHPCLPPVSSTTWGSG